MSRFLRVIAALIMIAVLVWLGLTLASELNSSGDDESALVAAVKASSVHAVTLDNDRVYFGTLKNTGDGFVRLERAYFIREAGTEKDGARQRVVSVSEIATEPDDDMLINKEHITHVQELKTDSQVAQAIKDLEEN